MDLSLWSLFSYYPPVLFPFMKVTVISQLYLSPISSPSPLSLSCLIFRRVLFISFPFPKGSHHAVSNTHARQHPRILFLLDHFFPPCEEPRHNLFSFFLPRFHSCKVGNTPLPSVISRESAHRVSPMHPEPFLNLYPLVFLFTSHFPALHWIRTLNSPLRPKYFPFQFFFPESLFSLPRTIKNIHEERPPSGTEFS